MAKKDIIKNVFEQLQSHFDNTDFILDKKNQWYICKHAEAVYTYDIHFYDRTVIKTGNKGVLVEPHIWINVKEISMYYKEVTMNRELKKEADFKILGNSVAELLANPSGVHKKWNESLGLYIFEEKDIFPVSKQIIKQFEKVALPYFENNGNVKMVDKLVNEFPNKKTVHISNDNHRIIFGLIAAKLNNNPKLETLINIYDKMIEDLDMIKEVKEELERLKSILPFIGKQWNVDKN